MSYQTSPHRRSAAGCRGPVDALDVAAVDGLLTRGGTTLGSARVAPEKLHAGLAKMKGVLAAHGGDVLVPIGGEGTLTAARLLSQAGVPVVGRRRRGGDHRRGPVRPRRQPSDRCRRRGRAPEAGQMVALRGTEIELVPPARAVARPKTVPARRMAETGVFTG